MKNKQLEYFLAAAEELNFTKAAEKLFISQTAITQQIKQLEESMGVTLFDRSQKRVKLTTAGKVFQKEAELLQKQLEQAVVRAQIASSGFAGDLHIGVATGLYNTHAPEVFAGFHQEYPLIHLDFSEGRPGEMLHDLQGRNYDYIVTPRFKEQYFEGLSYRVLDQYPVMAAMHKECSLAQKNRLTWGDLAGRDIIVSMTESEELLDISNILTSIPTGVILRSIRRNDNIESIMFSLACNMGVALLPAYFAFWLQKDNRIAVRNFSENLKTDICAIWRPDSQNPIIQNLLDYSADHSQFK